MSAALREVWLLFRYYPLRWLLSLMALVVGMATLTALVTIENNITRHSQALLAQQGGARLGVTIVNSGILPQSFEEWRTHLPAYCYPIPYYSLPLQIQSNHQPHVAEVIATSPDLFSKMIWSLQQGRVLHELDSRSKVIVVGAKLAEQIELQTQQSVLGDLVNLQGEYYRVIGVLDELSFDPVLNFDPNYTIFVHLAFSEHFIREVTLQDFVVFLNNTTLTKAEAEMRNLIHAMHPQSTLFVKNPEVLQKVLFKQIDLTIRILKIISLIALFLGFISMLNQFIIQLEERKSEMGVRLALGATLKVLAMQFFKETLIMAMVAGLLGMIVGMVGAIVVLNQLGLSFYWGFKPLLMGASLALLMGGLVGTIPAILVLRQSPTSLL